MGNLVIQFLHVKITSNRVVDVLANEGVCNLISFHAEGINNNKDGMIWKRCEEMVEDDVKS